MIRYILLSQKEPTNEMYVYKGIIINGKRHFLVLPDRIYFSSHFYHPNNNVNKNNYKEVFRELSVSKKDTTGYRSYFVNDSVCYFLNNLPDSIFFNTYINNTGSIKSPNYEIEKAVILKLLKRNIPIVIEDISGELTVSKQLISL